MCVCVRARACVFSVMRNIIYDSDYNSIFMFIGCKYAACVMCAMVCEDMYVRETDVSSVGI